MKKSQLFSQLKSHNHFAELGTEFSVTCAPIAIRDPQLVCINPKVASLLGIEQIDQAEVVNIFSGNNLPEHWQTIAQRYAGHQFGKFNHFLGDGRSLHLADIETQHGLFDICLKGSGKTPFARDADGRINLETGIKEFLLSRALDTLGTPTSQSLCLVKGKDPINRQGNIQPASVLTRVAPNFIRFGHFENFHYSGDKTAVKALADFCLKYYFKHCLINQEPYQAMLEEVVTATAKLIAHWQSVGFVHGTMNTDNQSILGLTLDHGSGVLMDKYDPDLVATRDDVKALFAFDQQPSVGAWNCGIFAQTLSSLINKESLADILDQYSAVFETHYMSLMRAKLGLSGKRHDDVLLIQDLLAIFKQHQLDYTSSIRGLSKITFEPENPSTVQSDQRLIQALADRNWLTRYQQRLGQHTQELRDQMNRVNPRFVLTNNEIDSVVREALNDDYAPLNTLLNSIENPF